jgi:hypothetical protein
LVRIECQQTHAKAFQNAQGSDANFTGADHASGFAVHGKAGQPSSEKLASRVR